MTHERCVCAIALIAALMPCTASAQTTVYVPAGGNLQAALTTARGGDTILLQPGATYSGNFKLPVHGGSTYVTIRSAASDAVLPGAGTRMSPAYSPYLPRIVSPNGTAALRTAAGAAYWRLQFLEIGPTATPSGTALDLGDGSAAQSTLASVPHHLIVDRVYVHGHALNGQRRGIGLNSSHTTVVNSHVADIKLVGQDSQAIGGWNGPGPFHIENNYLEGAGEVVMFGGDDPRIPYLSPSDIVFRGNTVTRPLSWRDPILPAPGGARASIAGDGTLAAGTYAYRVVARRVVSGTTIRSVAAAEVAVTTAASAAVKVQWDAVAGATEYLVYGRAPGAATQYWTVTATEFVDAGTTAGTAGTAPSTGTVWQVKNLFELKNARRVQVDYNIIENNWVQAQSGTAILFTSRNQYGACTWCLVEDVVFEHNIVRRTAGAVQLLGWDDERPSAQANNITIRHNEFSDFGKAWGSSAYFLYVIDAPLNVTVDHNTIVSKNGSGIIMADKRAAEHFVFTNNVMRHDTYGIFGSNSSTGLPAITRYFPGSRIENNVIAGGAASKYPAGNLFPTLAAFEANFASYATADFALIPTSAWRGAGTDGFDLGADIEELRAARDGVEAGPIGIDTSSLPDATEGQDYAARLQARGGNGTYTWQMTAGALPLGLELIGSSGELRGRTWVYGDFAITVKATDSWGTSTSRPFTLHVERAVPDVQIVTAALPPAMATVPYAFALEAQGGRGSYAWTAAGTLPAGLSLDAAGVLSGTPLAPGTAAISVTAQDTTNPQRQASITLPLFVDLPPNQPPSVALLNPMPNAVVQAFAPLTFAATVSDADGGVVRVDYYVDDVLFASAAGPAFTAVWPTVAPGRYIVRAVAVDDRGGATSTERMAITTRSEVVLYGSDVVRTAGAYQMKADGTAAGGSALWNPNRSLAKVATAAAAPASLAEFTFYAEAGRPYQVWIRGRAEWNDPGNDSVHLQFDGVAGARIGTTGSRVINLEETVLAGVSGWVWQDTGYGAGVLGTPVVFETTGLQTLRVQPREDGLLVDQIVISPEQYLLVAPGALTNDSTIVGR